ncbi:hypothetical protein GGR56DRAFT_614079 [Xylariaceae sp. FL0804]|nr:hypothetical protein GGR56DRAFT_614079 [Xylariaceae sp. FL0804]
MNWVAQQKPYIQLPDRFLTTDADSYDPKFKNQLLRVREGMIEELGLLEWLEVADDFPWKDDQPGHIIMICGESTGPFGRELSSIPIPADVFGEINAQFKLHKHLIEVIRLMETDISATILEDSHQKVHVFTALMQSTISKYWLGHMAIASTYSTVGKTSRAIVLGCNRDNLSKITRQLERRSDGLSGHPLLLIGVFAEIQRDRYKDMAREIGSCAETLAQQSLAQSFGLPKFSDDDLNEIREARQNSLQLQEEVLEASRQIQKVVSYIDLVLDTSALPEHLVGTKRFRGRFLEIRIEYENILDRSKSFVSQMDITTNFYWQGQINQATARLSVGLALVTVFYLPATIIATLFAMPVFDFKADWRDIHNRPTGDNQDGEGPVVSVYLWWYLLATAILTVFTLAFYWSATQGFRVIPDWATMPYRNIIPRISELWKRAKPMRSKSRNGGQTSKTDVEQLELGNVNRGDGMMSRRSRLRRAMTGRSGQATSG